jgi:hypothetical protein
LNERIRQLALKAGGGLSCIAEPLEHPWKFSERELEKFAELIVRECMTNLYLNGYDDAVIQIQKHFGVEE